MNMPNQVACRILSMLALPCALAIAMAVIRLCSDTSAALAYDTVSKRYHPRPPVPYTHVYGVFCGEAGAGGQKEALWLAQMADEKGLKLEVEEHWRGQPAGEFLEAFLSRPGMWLKVRWGIFNLNVGFIWLKITGPGLGWLIIPSALPQKVHVWGLALLAVTLCVLPPYLFGRGMIGLILAPSPKKTGTKEKNHE